MQRPLFRILGVFVDTKNHNTPVGFRLLEESTLQAVDTNFDEAYMLFTRGCQPGQSNGSHFKVLPADDTITLRFSLRIGKKKENKPKQHRIFDLIIFTDGTKWKNYPVLDAHTKQVIHNDFVIVRAKMIDEKGNIEGYLVADANLAQQGLTFQELLSYKDVGFVNIKVVTKQGTTFIQTLKGELPYIFSSVARTKGPHLTHGWVS